MTEFQGNTEATSNTTEMDVPAGINPAIAKEESSKEVEKTENSSTEVKKALKKIKWRGKEVELDDDSITSYAQKGFDAEEKWHEASRMKKEAEQFMSRLKSDPLSVLKDPNIGVDFKQIAEEFIWEQIQDERLTPEERERRKIEKELNEYREKDRKAREDEEMKRNDEIRQTMRADFDRKIAETLSKSGLPRSKHMLEKFSMYLLHDVRRGIERPMEVYVDAVRKDYIDDMQHFFGESPADLLVKFIGDKNMKKIREHDIKSVKSPTPNEGHTFVPGKGMIKNERKRIRGDEWEKDLRSKFLNR